jgi:hypothetical protein
MKWSTQNRTFCRYRCVRACTFLFLVAWIALVHWQQGQSLAAVLAGVFFILAIFLCVVLHEFGHALMARRYGVKPATSSCCPSAASRGWREMPTQPIQELWVALAGPAVNVVIAVALLCLALDNSFLGAPEQPYRDDRPLPRAPAGGQHVHDPLQHDPGVSHGRRTRSARSHGNPAGVQPGHPDCRLHRKGIAVFFGAFGLFYNPFWSSSPSSCGSMRTRRREWPG